MKKSCRIMAYISSVLLCSVLVQITNACHGGSLIHTGITQQDKIDVLETHNRLRQQVAMGQVNGQPGAQDMMEMKWDEELAAKAQSWANQCIFEHDESRYLDRFIMGQNLGLMWSTASLDGEEGDFKTRINSWFKEVNLYSFGGPYTSKNGHYSQLIWGQSNLVGCGFSYYFARNRYNKLWVCNYGPGGNIVGVSPYTTGYPSCSNHGLSTSRRWPGLCDDGTGAVFSNPPPVQPTYENVIPDTGYSYDQNAYTDALNKYNQYEVNSYVAPTPKPQPVKLIPQSVIRTTVVQQQQPQYSSNKLSTDYTFSSFGFNRQQQNQQQQQQQQQAVVTSAPVYNFATTPKPAYQVHQQQQQQQDVKQHSAFFTYNWDSLFKNYYSYNNK